jgi:hypothetical protein
MDYQEAMQHVATDHLVARMSWNGGHVRLHRKTDDGSFSWAATRDLLPQDMLADDWYVLGTLN